MRRDRINRLEKCGRGISQDRRGSGASTTRAGIIGNGILNQFAVTLDYAQRRMILDSCVSG
jgi:hypothetical protein